MLWLSPLADPDRLCKPRAEATLYLTSLLGFVLVSPSLLHTGINEIRSLVQCRILVVDLLDTELIVDLPLALSLLVVKQSQHVMCAALVLVLDPHIHEGQVPAVDLSHFFCVTFINSRDVL